MPANSGLDAPFEPFNGGAPPVRVQVTQSVFQFLVGILNFFILITFVVLIALLYGKVNQIVTNSNNFFSAREHAGFISPEIGYVGGGATQKSEIFTAERSAADKAFLEITFSISQHGQRNGMIVFAYNNERTRLEILAGQNAGLIEVFRLPIPWTGGKCSIEYTPEPGDTAHFTVYSIIVIDYNSGYTIL